jgi:hypothetical protein
MTRRLLVPLCLLCVDIAGSEALVEIASETHLPRESFIEYLVGFSSRKHCGLELKKRMEKRFTTDDLKSILESFVSMKIDKRGEDKVATALSVTRLNRPSE